jgi:hypothetical protein
MFAVIDIDLKKAYPDLFSDSPLDIPDWQHGSTQPLEVCIARRLSPAGQGVRVREPLDLTGWGLDASLGKGFQTPIAGTYTLTFGANTTTALSFDATAAQIATALNLLASISAAGGVTVANITDANGSEIEGFFSIAFGSNGDRALITGDETSLAPSSVLDFGELVGGTAGRKEVQLLRIVQNPAAMASLTIASDPASAAVVPVQAGGGGLNQKGRIYLGALGNGSPLVIGGRYKIEHYETGDDFVNVGGMNGTGETFTATDVIPTTWTNGSVLTRIGAQPPFEGQFSLVVRGLESAMISWGATAAEVMAALEEIQLTSGLLVVGAKYKIVSYLGTDDFTNVGAASNATGVVFVASGTTPADWTALSVLTPVGAGNVAVSEESNGVYLFAFQGDMANTDMDEIEVDGSALRVMSTLSGVLDLRNANTDLLVANNANGTSVDFELQGTPPGETLQKLFREAGLLVDSIRDPSNTSPAVKIDYVLKTVAGKYRFKDDGSFQLYNATQAKFHTLTITGAATEEILNIEAGEV